MAVGLQLRQLFGGSFRKLLGEFGTHVIVYCDVLLDDHVVNEVHVAHYRERKEAVAVFCTQRNVVAALCLEACVSEGYHRTLAHDLEVVVVQFVESRCTEAT